ncbi:FimV/HubP family polar landmark protein [Pseudomonas chlororaphis]|uniref:LysM domain-containing protein n=1 Tax=Pseudomonas chlororaphis TaxID=587753 RepID=A0AAX3G6W7_9PSED|nr:FimV/HubP family polar landmark protein [Pseudomonas chlororaphis]AZC36513.1 putative type IV pilus assembly FimV-related transmembrane protein [Pseudomonas chlororaphis subsp. piscium]AZC43058.1 putative type IV pilus assembly FimV-related transmembrane protein [Pseudomonas chlororaphis subsp. piscium]WDG74951.1 FimV family protein [Pseudomonas chlororaphis]WDH27413.1 FimV family protein [Pseudomonas chlororaphis]WDH73471.1 FimV family protein [Pseudomonas chlororaphis]
MVQVRKLVLAIAAASALSSGMAQALGLGELTLKSTLNQPLVAEIELLDVKDLTAAEVVPSLASPEDFAKAGVDRQAFLNDLSFTPVLNANGKSVLRVTSSQPLSEPMVKFLVQVMWPNGRLLRDYSVLLDPSKFSPQTAEAAAQSATQAPAIAAPVTGAGKPAQYTTSARDTLWEIAAKARNGGSVQQTMLAIQALNPDAFIDGNINRLKTGQVLRLPDAVQSTSLPQPQAIAEVAAQNTAWRQGRRLAPRGAQQQLDGTRRAGADKAPAQGAVKDSLSLVSAESGKARGKGAAGDSQALSNKLAVTQESLDAARRDNAELKSRMTDLQSQLDKLQRLIELKNDQLAKLQAEGAGAAAPAQPTAAMPAQLAEQPATPAAPVTDPAAAPGETPTEAAPAQAQTPASDEDKFNDLLTNPILLGLAGGGAVLVLLLLLLLARRRKAQQEAEKHLRMARALSEEAELSKDLDLPESSFEGLEVPPPSVKLAPAPAPAPVVAPVVATAPVAAAVEHPADVLDQAQSHIDGGRLNQAAAILEEAVKLEPQRSELRLKLMEVYGHQGDRSAFVAQERQLVANGKNHAEVEQLKSRFPAMAAVAAAGLGAAAVAAALDAQYVKELLLDEPQEPAPAPAIDDLDTDFDLSLDDLEAASPASLAAPAVPAQVEPELDEFPLDDDLSFESVLQQQTEAKESLDDLSDFDLDLGEDLPAAAQADEDFLLSLDDDLKDLPAVEVPTVTEAALDDLELPADFDLSLADEMDAQPAAKDAFVSELDDVNAELDRLSQSLEQPALAEPTFTAEDAAGSADEGDFDFLSGSDEVATKLDLAQAYIDMGDNDGARDILGEVISEGNDGQKSEAKEMLARLV